MPLVKKSVEGRETRGEGAQVREYPPNEKHNYPHYKGGFKSWRATPFIDKISLTISIAALVISLIRFIV